MTLTTEQLSYLERCASGLVWTWHKIPSEDEILRFLIDEGLISPRVDIADDLIMITQKGLQTLQEFYERSGKHSKKEAQRRFQNKVSVAQVLVPLVVFILGLIVEHFSNILGKLLELFG